MDRGLEMKKGLNIKPALKKMLPHLLAAKEQNINEADTVVRVMKVFEDVLSYDPLAEISREAQLRDKYVDLLIKLDSSPKLIVEVKAAGVSLRDKHIEQAENYASRNNFPWVLLTNGVVWTLYHLTFEEGIEYDKAFSVDLSKDDFGKAADSLVLLHRENMKGGGLEEYWECQKALSPLSIGRALLHEDVLGAVRRQVRRDTGRSMQEEELAEAVKAMLSREVLEAMGPLKIRRNRKVHENVPQTKPDAIAPIEAVKEIPPVDESPSHLIDQSAEIISQSGSSPNSRTIRAR
jgi:hypothetical protein